MSIENTYKALDLVGDSEDCDTSGPQSEDLIAEAEKMLGLSFPDSYRSFLGRVGYLSYGGFEVYGLSGGELSSPSVPNAVWYTMNHREMGMGSNLFLIGHSELGCPAIRVSEAQRESPVVAYYLGFPEEAQTYEVLAPDFGSYLLDQIRIIKDELDAL